MFFSTEPRIGKSWMDLKKVAPLNKHSYNPGGGTALLDAVGTTIRDAGIRFAKMPFVNQPKKVIMAIITDGEENSSHEYTYARVSEMIGHQRAKYGWEFIFQGANIDSFKVGASLNIPAHNTSNFVADSFGVSNAYGNVGATIRSFRTK